MPHSSPKPALVVAVTDAFRTRGGIPRYNRMLLESARTFAAERGYSFSALSLSDAGHATAVQGCDGNKALLGSRLLGALGLRHGLLVLGHINLAPFLHLTSRLHRWRSAVVTYGIEVWGEVKPLRRSGLLCSDTVWSISNFTARHLVDIQGVRGDHIRLLPCSLSLEMEHALAARPVVPRAEDPLLLTVTRLGNTEQHKGVDTCIKAVSRLRSQFPGLKYDVVGSGPDVHRHRALAERLGVGDRVRFLGALPDAELIDAYRRAWVFALPSRKEGFGIVFLEAWAAGLPIVGCRAGGTPDVIEDTVSGYLVPYNDTEFLSDRFAQLFTMSQAERDTMARAGQERLRTRFSPVTFEKRTHELLSELAAA